MTDPYIRLFHQIRNFMELLETILRFRTSGEEIHVHLVTCAEEGKPMQQLDQLTRIPGVCTQDTSSRTQAGRFHWTEDSISFSPTP